jgi:hypothetical protein
MSRLYKSPPTDTPNPTAPTDRIASLPEANVPLPESAIQPSALSAPAVASPAAVAPVSANQEVIVIVRDRNNPAATSRVMTLQQPTADLMQMIQRQAR